MINRLKREISDLRLRCNVNLLIGMSITMVGLYILWLTVSTISNFSNSMEFAELLRSGNITTIIQQLAIPMIPRLLLVLFIEVFSYFFLMLYKNGLADIKYFQNELTNIESKIAAVEYSLISNTNVSLQSAIDSLSKTERNFIIEKKQTTIELEKHKHENDITKTLIKLIPNLLSKTNK